MFKFQSDINNTLRYLLHTNDSFRPRDFNFVRHDGGAGKLHRELVQRVCDRIQEVGHTFLCRPLFATGRCRPDVIDLVDGIIYEITDTEGHKTLKIKRFRYPFDIIVVNENNIDSVLREIGGCGR